MRTFEFILLLMNALALFLSFKKQSKIVWLMAAGVNAAALLVHGLIEGFRYQMVFAYVFAVLFTVYALVKASRKSSERRIPKALKISAITLFFMFLALTSFLAYAFPVFTFPEPAGGYAVGVRYFHFVDESRPDPFLDSSVRNRELMVKVFYPAKQDDSKLFAPYFHGSSELLGAFAAFYHLPGFMFDHLSLVKTHSKEGLALSDEQPGYPVILFSHGAGTSMEVETSQSEDLASRGYVVVSVDHTYVSAATLFPDRIANHHDGTTNFQTPEPAEVITQIMAEDVAFVIEKLSEMNAGSTEPMFEGRLDLDAMGVIGHSVGGAVAYNLGINDSRIKAAVNLDGAVYISPETDGNMAPFLMLANDTYHIQALESRESLMPPPDMTTDTAYAEAYNRAQQNVTALVDGLSVSGNLYTIKGCSHMKLTDMGLFIGVQWLRELIQFSGETEPARCLEITQALTAVFFDQHLKNEAGDSLESLTTKYWELKKVELN